MTTRHPLPRRTATTLALLLASVAPLAAQSDVRGDSLYKAAADNDTATVRRLLAAGVDPNHQLRTNGRTPLIGAAVWGQTAAARLLLAAGARREITDKDGRTARSWAEQTLHEGVAELLRGAAANAVRKEPAPATPTPAAGPAMPRRGVTPRDGQWRGTIAGITTGGGQTVAFRVVGGRIVDTDFLVDYHCAPAYAYRERARWGFRESIPVVDGAFARLEKAPNTDLEVAGRFPTATTGEGTFLEEDTSGCTTRRARWTAVRVGR